MTNELHIDNVGVADCFTVHDLEPFSGMVRYARGLTRARMAETRFEIK